MKTVRKQLTYDHTKDKGEVFTMPSLTQPDMAYTPREILQRFAKGLPLPQSRYLSYQGDEYLPDPRTLDMVEIDELREKNDAFIKQLEDEFEAKLAARKELKRKRIEAAKSKDGEERSDEQNDAEQVQ